LRLLPNIRFGTEQYPPKVARRLRALNITTWSAAVLGSIFAVTQLLDPTPGAWKVALTNVFGSLALAMIPMLHRIGPRAAPAGFAIIIYTYIFVVCWQIGVGTGMQIQYLAVAAVTILFLGTERIFLISAFAVSAVALIIILEILVPRNTGLLRATTVFYNFIFGVSATCAILFAVVFYAVREAARAEAVAEHEHARSEALLANILPATIADRLKTGTESVIADRCDDASILFADMAGFTARTSDTSPDELVQFLNRVFTDLDRLVESHGLEKIKTTGDAYMVVSGVPRPRPDHAQALAALALDMRNVATNLRDAQERSVPIRIGIASGALNVASRMESTGVLGRIQVSQATYEHLVDEFMLESRGQIEVKGKGEMATWFLVAHKVNAAVACLTDRQDLV
jgi:adenylate cyclase